MCFDCDCSGKSDLESQKRKIFAFGPNNQRGTKRRGPLCISEPEFPDFLKTLCFILDKSIAEKILNE